MELSFNYPAPICHQAGLVITRNLERVLQVIEVRHSLAITIVPAMAVSDGSGCGFGVFLERRGKPVILIAGEPPPDLPRRERPDMVLETLLHELVHYEQWRDGRPLTERGVAVRTRSLLAKIKNRSVC